MKPSIQTLGQILYSPSQYVIPVFQRNYRWDRPQWEKLWTSLLDIQSPGKTGNHFMGFLVFVPGLAQPGQHTRFHLIDGQQRLTTSSLLMAALRNVARELGQADLAEEIHNYFLVHPLKKGDQHFRLLPKEHDQESYLALISEKSEPSGRMADALEYFEQQLAAEAKTEPQALRRIFDVACQRLEFMCATLEAENAYNIFKSLNSTGVPLGPSDLIRNFVFMHVPPDDQDEFDSEYWAQLEAGFSDEDGRLEEDRFSRFFRDVLMMDGRYVQPKETFATFEARHEATGFSPKTLASDLVTSARHYAVIAGHEHDPDSDVTAALVGLNALESSTTYPLLLALFWKRAAGQIDSTQLAKCIQMLRGFILRRFVCAESSRGYGQMFVRALAKDSGDPVATLETYLLERGWPDDRRFELAFASFPLYQRGYTKTVLEAIERARGHKEPPDLTTAQVEHIMPQTLSVVWTQALGQDAPRVHSECLHRPGNLTLSAYNQELGNQPFERKRERFAMSNVLLTRELGAVGAWGEAAIQQRGERLAREAKALWMGPKEPYIAPVLVSDDDDAFDKRELRLKFWTGLSERLAESEAAIPELDPRSTRAVRLPPTVRHIGTELRHVLQPKKVAIDVYFWRAASRPLWEQLRADPSEINQLTGGAWTFDQSDGGSAWMTLSLDAATEDEHSWPALYDWFVEKLQALYTHGVPMLREGMQAIAGEKGSGEADGDESASQTGSITSTKGRQFRFWKQVIAALAEREPKIKPQKAWPQHWHQVSLGRSGFVITSSVNHKNSTLGCHVYIECKDAKHRFAQLLAMKGAIEAKLGFPLEWQELPDRNACRIAAYRPDGPLHDESRWEEYVDWIVGRIALMDSVFRPIVKGLP
jgi:hypothetical protein